MPYGERPPRLCVTKDRSSMISLSHLRPVVTSKEKDGYNQDNINQWRVFGAN